MPLHSQVLEFFKQRVALGLRPLEQCTPAEFRQMMLADLGVSSKSDPTTIIENQTANSPSGAIPLRIYRSKAEPSPALVYFHGGGWVGGNLETHDGLCRALCHAAGCTVIAVDYRLAPEHKYPTACEDAFAATCWIQEHAAALQVDGRRIAVGGDSAGGNLAAVVSLMTRDRRRLPPCLQVLLYPITDCDLTTASYQKYAEGYGLTRAAMQWFWQHYQVSKEDVYQPYASPLRANSLHGLPPALVITAEFDVLCDEGEAYAERLRAAGVPTELTRYDGMIHGFMPRLNQFDSAREAVGQVATALTRAFSSAS